MTEAHSQSAAKIMLGRGAWVWRDAIRWNFSRSRGPGGQAVNKISTKAELRLALRDIQAMDEDARTRLRSIAGRKLTVEDELLITADVTRSQLENRQACLDRLTVMVGSAMKKPRVRKKTAVPKAVKRKRLDGKRQRSAIKSSRQQARWEDD
jgi:ribosome-associated protein